MNNRSFVGTILCMTVYHVDILSSDTQELCKFLQTLFQLTVGLLRTIRISCVTLSARSISYIVEYSPRVKGLLVSISVGVSM